MRLLGFIIIALGFFLKTTASEVIQFHGLIRDRETHEPLEFVHIIRNNKEGTISDRFGRFSFLTAKRDTIVFSSLGYKTDTLIIPDSTEGAFFQKEISLARDTIPIEEVIILPWKDYEAFKEAFMELDLPDDDLERARKNIAIIKTQLYMDAEPSPTISFRNMMNQQYEETFSYGQVYPYVSLLDPLAWSRFIKALKEGKFKNDKEE